MEIDWQYIGFVCILVLAIYGMVWFTSLCLVMFIVCFIRPWVGPNTRHAIGRGIKWWFEMISFGNIV